MSETTSIRASRDAAVDLRRIAGRLAAETGRPVSLGDALAAVVAAIGEDISTVLQHLPDAHRTQPGDQQPGTHRGDQPPAPYGERRPYVVADRLDELHGPTDGVVKLPLRLNWSGSPVYDLDRPGRLRSMYETVLREAMRSEDLSDWLDGATLIRLWPDLKLPKKPRRLWEERFPELTETRLAAEE